MKRPLRIAITSSLLLIIIAFWIFGSTPRGWFVAHWFYISPDESSLILRFLPIQGDDYGDYQHSHGLWFLGFGAYKMTYRHASHYSLVIPYWAIIALLGILLWRQVRAWGRFREIQLREAEGHCLSCGYDLRASPGQCPECGAALAPKS